MGSYPVAETLQCSSYADKNSAFALEQDRDKFISSLQSTVESML